jgi:hypothetical protein
MMKTNPAIGWVRGDNVPDESAARTINNLRDKVDELTGEIDRVRREPPKGTEGLAQGNDRLMITMVFGPHFNRTSRDHQMSWNEVFSAMSPCMIREGNEYSIKQALAEFVKKRAGFLKDAENVEVEIGSFHKTIVQLRALGLIIPSEQKRSVKDRGIMYWSLTPFGDEQMNRLLAIPRSS